MAGLSEKTVSEWSHNSLQCIVFPNWPRVLDLRNNSLIDLPESLGQLANLELLGELEHAGQRSLGNCHVQHVFY